MHQIGIGVLGPLFRASDAAGRIVAVKTFRLDLTPEQADRFTDALRDVIGVGLSSPSIVPLLDTGLVAGTPYLVSEYVAGSSLDVILRNASGRLPGAPELVARIAGAIDGAHAGGVMHGTLHLRDVIVDGDRVHVSGFGVANVLEHVGLRVPIRRPYAAPELVTGRHWGPEADRYALAAIGYELLTGLRASGSGDDVLTRLRDLAGIDVADRAGLQQAFRNGLAEDPSLRPASARQFATALSTALDPASSMPESVAAPPEAATAVEDEAAPRVEPNVEVAAAKDESEPAIEVAPIRDRVEPTVEVDPLEPADVDESAASEEETFALVAEPVVPDDDDGEFDDDDVASEDPMPDHLASSRRRDPPVGQRLVLRSVAPVAVALVIGLGLAFALGLELPSPEEASDGSSIDTPPAANTGAETSAPPAPGAVTPPTVVDSAPRAVAGFEAPVQPTLASRTPAPPPEPVEDAPAAADERIPQGGPPAAEASAPTETVDPEPALGPPTGPGAVYLDTRPPGAIVLIDGETAGVTPLLLPDIAAGAHQVRFELAGYLPWTTDIAVTAEEEVRVGASLQPDGSR